MWVPGGGKQYILAHIATKYTFTTRPLSYETLGQRFETLDCIKDGKVRQQVTLFPRVKQLQTKARCPLISS